MFSVGKGQDGDGSNDTIITGSNNFPTGTADFTLSGWCNFVVDTNSQCIVAYGTARADAELKRLKIYYDN